MPEQNAPFAESHPHQARRIVTSVAAVSLAAGGTWAGFKIHDQAEQLQAYERKNIEQEAERRTLENQIEDFREAEVAQDQIVERLAELAATGAGVTKEQALGVGLTVVEDLAGFGSRVSEADKAEIQDATVKIYSRPKDASAWWSEKCTGLKVIIDQASYIATAGHCLTFQKGGGKGGLPDDFKAVGVTGNVAEDYAVQKPAGGVILTGFEPVESISTGVNADWALFRLANPNAFSNIQGVDYQRMTSYRPNRGEEAIIHGIPTDRTEAYVEGRGVYLGSIAAGNKLTAYDQSLAIVGLTDADSGSEDACNYGSSGSAAAFASGRISGPLAYRNNIGYDNGSEDTADGGVRLEQRLIIERELYIDTSRFKTLCGFSEADTSVAQELVRALNEQ